MTRFDPGMNEGVELKLAITSSHTLYIPSGANGGGGGGEFGGM